MNNLATIGHNSASYREMIAAEPAVVFRDSAALPALIAEIEAEIAGHSPDLSSKRGRDAIASMAAKIAKRKTAIDDAGKRANEEARAQINRIDEVRRAVRSSLDGLRDKARSPLTEWEAEQEARDARVNATFGDLDRYATGCASLAMEDIDRALSWVANLALDGPDFDGMVDVARDKALKAAKALAEAKADLVRREEEKAELARLRAAEEERARVVWEAEAKAAAEAAERERIVAAARDAEEKTRREVEQEAEAERAALQRQHEAEIAAERKKLADAERQRAEEEAARRRAIADAEARAADQQHRSEFMRAAKEALMEHAGIPEDRAKKAVLAIVAGSVPNVILKF